MRAALFAIRALIITAAMAQPAWAGLTAEILDADGDPHRLDIASAAEDVPFTISLYVTSTFAMGSAQMMVQNLTEPGVFELLGRTFDTSAGWSASSGDSLPFTPPDLLTGPPDGACSQDIGTLAVDLLNGVPAGTVRLVTISAKVKAGTATGVYQLNLRKIECATLQWQSIFGTAGTPYTVRVGPAAPSADFDQDGDVDMVDFAQFQTCFNGPNRQPLQENCGAADFDADSDVDMVDFAYFQSCFNGPNRQPLCTP